MKKIVCKSCCPECEKDLRSRCTCCREKPCSEECKKCCGQCTSHQIKLDVKGCRCCRPGKKQ